MATASMSTFLRRLTRGMAAETLRDESDRQLVERLLAGRDEAVFEAIVRRHGPMVYRVCWRVLQQEQDTEDAFQATFLILAQQVRTVRRRASLASWLHGIAHRVALKARAQGAIRRRHEQKAATEKFPPDEVTWRELRAALDAELEQLPEKWRLPLVLCYLEGQTQDEAARQLGSSQRTLRRRLEEAKAALRRRLIGRGVVWPAVLSAVLLSDCVAPAALAPRLVRSTVEAAACIAAGQAARTAAVSTNVAALTEGVLKTMFSSKLKIVAAALVLLTAVAAGAGGLLHQTQAAEPQQPPQDYPKSALVKVPLGVPAARPGDKPKAAPKPVVVHEDSQIRKLAWSSNGKILATVGIVYETVEFTDGDGKPTNSGGVIPHSTIKLWDATTGKLKRALGEEKDTYIAAIAFSADGKTAAISTSKHVLTKDPKAPFKYETEVRVMDAQTWALKHKVKTDGFASALAFSPDGTRLALGGKSGFKDSAAFVRLWDVQKQKLVGGTAGGGYRVSCLAFSSDGKQLATGDENGKVRLFDGRTGAARRDFEGQGPLRAGGAQCVTGVGFSSDGKTLVSGSMDKTLKLWNVEAGKLLRTLEGNKGPVVALAFSWDGKFFATAGNGGAEGKSVEVLLWDTKTWKPKKAFPDQTTPVNSLAFSPDGSTLAIGSGKGFHGGPDTGIGRLKTPGEFKLWKLK